MELKELKKEDLILESKKFFETYKKEIGESIREGESIVKVNFQNLAEFSPDLSEKLIESPEETLALMENALEESGLVKNPRLRFTNLAESTNVQIRNIRAKHLDQFITIEGIVKQASSVSPQVVNARFECPSCGAILSVLQIEKKFREPSRCSCGRKGLFKLISKEMVDAQRLVIEESPDTLTGGEQPRRLSVFLKEDLVDPKMEERTTPGSKVKILGVLKEVPIPLQTGAISTRFDLAVEANNAIPLEETFEDLQISEEEEKQILELAADPDVFNKLSKSIAPSVYGFERIKEALLLQLFSGIKKIKSDGVASRGDIHILLVGDPGVAKSVTLKFISSIAPRGRYVSGKAATGAGLCVSPKSMLLTNPGGMQQIQNIVEPRLNQTKNEYRPGIWKKDNIDDIKIQSLSKNLKIQSKNPKSIWKLNSPKKVYEVTLSSGKKIELTGNTCLFTINGGNTSWEKSTELQIGDYIATPRKLIGGKIKKQFTIDLIQANPVIHNIKSVTKNLVKKLQKKYGTIRKASKDLKINEGQLYYNWVNEKASGNIKLNNLKKIAKITKTNWKEKVSNISLYNRKNHKIPIYLDKELLYLAGLIAGDGELREDKSRSKSIRFSNSNKTLHKIFKKTLKNRFALSYDIQKGNEKRPEATRTSSQILSEILHSLGIPLSPKSQKLHLSNNLLHLSNKLLAGYIAGLYDADGCVYNQKNSKSGCIEFHTISEKLARQLQLVLLRFSIHARLRKRMPETIKSNYPIWILEIRSLNEIQKFAKQIPIKHPDKKKILKKLSTSKIKPNTNIDIIPDIKNTLKKISHKYNVRGIKFKTGQNISREKLQKILCSFNINHKEVSELKKIAESDIFWEKITSIKEKIPDYEYVYDLTVKDSHNFVVDGVLVHNTAVVVRDEFLRGWSLEGGAMVLSNKGIVCVDEIEKMSEHDRSTMHEALEQQTVTISKANIQATLRSETSVLAAGNPKLGRFDPYTPIPQQIDISPALLSRFDIIFILRDLPNRKQDEAIATHVLEEHKQEVFRDIINTNILRKYISFARKKIKPKLTDEAIEEIKNFYISLRNQSIRSESEVKPIPITARQLEAIVRLSESCAKVRLSEKVTREDSLRAIDLLKTSLMQVGYDEETKTFDIDRVTTGITTSKRSKILVVKEALSQLETKLGKLIPLVELEQELITTEKMSKDDLEEVLDGLSKSGEIFKPKKGYIQKV